MMTEQKSSNSKCLSWNHLHFLRRLADFEKEYWNGCCSTNLLDHAVAAAAIKLENVFKSSVWFVFFLSLSVVFSDQDPLWSVDGCSLSVHLNPCQSELMSDSSASANFPVQWIPFFSKGVPLPLPENRWILALDQERPNLGSSTLQGLCRKEPAQSFLYWGRKKFLFSLTNLNLVIVQGQLQPSYKD